jgi:ferritin-like protein
MNSNLQIKSPLDYETPPIRAGFGQCRLARGVRCHIIERTLAEFNVGGAQYVLALVHISSCTKFTSTYNFHETSVAIFGPVLHESCAIQQAMLKHLCNLRQFSGLEHVANRLE